MVQFWKNGVFVSNVSENEANEIIKNYKQNPTQYEVYDMNMPNHFSVEETTGKKKKRTKHDNILGKLR